ncbi:MAG TPA: rRNA maturation RNase YbeY [Elusimicrobiales bacterium]|nr:rRNA maturation RNase YbeY [Elusimicrobiales bacterium]HOL63151.1 rRNA maturation RNase YbeY [Elusimicrobiales bacterium]HPO95450.1 rRNA maturation RNase YbeY [Elusimicrobiales bacterium]
MKIDIENNSKKNLNEDFIKTIKKTVLKTLEFSKKEFDEINVILVTDPEIKKINKKFLNKNKTTDVIAFNYPSAYPLKLADIFISADTAKKNSKYYGLAFETELLILCVHGTLHISGYDDKTKSQRKKMNELTFKIIKNVFDKII